MADTWAEIYEFSTRTTDGTATYNLVTHSGDTVKAVAVFLCGATSTGSFIADRIESIGFADGTSNGCSSAHCEDNSANSQTDRKTEFNTHGGTPFGEVLCVLDSSGAVATSAYLSSLGSGSVALEYDNTDGAARQGFLIAFGGGDLTVDMGKIDAPAALGDVTVTTGFPTRLCLFASTMTGISTTSSVWSCMSFGAFSWDGATLKQGAVVSNSVDGEAAAKNTSSVWNAEMYAAHNTDALNYPLNVDNVTATAFDVNNDHATNDDTSDDLIYLALGGLSDVWVELFNPTTGGGANEAYTLPGFESEVLLFALTRQTTEATADVGGEGPGGSVAYAAVDQSGSEVCLSVYDEDVAATMNTASRYDGSVWTIFDDSQGTTNDWQCALGTSGITATGWTIDQSAGIEGSSSHYFLGIAFEKGTGAAAGGMLNLQKPHWTGGMDEMDGLT